MAASIVLFVKPRKSFFQKAPCGYRIARTRAKAGPFGPRDPRLDHLRVLSRLGVNLLGMDQKSEFQFASRVAGFWSKVFAEFVRLNLARVVERVE